MPGSHTIRLVEIPSFEDERGTLAVIEWPQRLAFVPQRFYYIYEIDPLARRAGHAHWQECEAILAVSGSVTILTDDGSKRAEHRLDRPDLALIIPPGVWHEIYGFEPSTVCGVFASCRYNSEDYCRDHNEFLRIVGTQRDADPSA